MAKFKPLDDSSVKDAEAEAGKDSTDDTTTSDDTTTATE